MQPTPVFKVGNQWSLDVQPPGVLQEDITVFDWSKGGNTFVVQQTPVDAFAVGMDIRVPL